MFSQSAVHYIHAVLLKIYFYYKFTFTIYTLIIFIPHLIKKLIPELSL